MHVSSHPKILAKLLKGRDRGAPAMADFHRRWWFSARAEPPRGALEALGIETIKENLQNRRSVL